MKRKSKINQDVQFVKNSIVKVPRTTHFLKKDWQGTFNAGDLIPFHKMDVLPGDTHSIKLNTLIRTTGPLIKPIAGLMEMHIGAYFVPFRITWRNWDKFMSGFQDDPDWTTDPEYVVPHLDYYGTNPTQLEGAVDFDVATIWQGSVGDMLGLPCGIIPSTHGQQSISALYARGYCLVWNNWYRDEATQTSISVPTTDQDGYLTMTRATIYQAGQTHVKQNEWTKLIDWYSDKTQIAASDWNDIYGTKGPLKYGKLLPINKKRDLFTSALPQPQKGAPVSLSIGGVVPVIADNNGWAEVKPIKNSGTWGEPDFDFDKSNSALYNFTNDKDMYLENLKLSSNIMQIKHGISSPYHDFASVGTWTHAWQNFADISSINPRVDLSQTQAINVNDLRLAVQTQLIKEIDARYGTRAKEYYYGHFGVLTADARLQIPEFLGSATIPLNVNQVVQNSASEEFSPQANLAAYSQTIKNKFLFTKSFTEYGFIMLVCGIRSVGGAYSQGVSREWTKQTRFDFYLPEFDHIGEQPLYNRELFLQRQEIDPSTLESEEIGLDNKGVFGYQAAWFEHRNMFNSVHGLLRPDAEGTLAYWNLSYDFKDTPTLSPEFIKEDKSLIDRALAYPCINPETGEYTGVDQFMVEFWIQDKATRPMSAQSIPGFMDHSGRILL